MMTIANPSRRLLLKGMGLLPVIAYGLTGAPRRVGAEEPSCAVAPAMTEGPYWLDKKYHRADIAADSDRASVREGLPLELTIQVFRAEPNQCGETPAQNVQIDIWHADAIGEYSGVSSMGQSDTRGDSFLRGYQITDGDGRVRFTTIYPGWYQDRSIHIHVRARTYDANGNTTHDFTSQFFFEESLNDQVHANAPYNSRGTRDTLNSEDMHYLGVTAPLMITTTENANGGIVGQVAIGLTDLPSDITPLNNFSATSLTEGDLAALTLSSTMRINDGDVGAQGSLYALAEVDGVWYVREGETWRLYTAAMANAFPAVYTGPLANQHTLPLLAGMNMNALGSVKIFVGYGANSAEMLTKQQYQLIYSQGANS